VDYLSHQKKNSLKWLTGLSVVVLFAILFFGLRPKDFNFSNNVSRIEGLSGIRFRKYGIAYTDTIEEFRNAEGFGNNGFSIEIALNPLENEEGFNFILVLHNGNDRSQLLLGQWRSWIIAMNGDDYDHTRRVKRISVNTASRPTAMLFITLTTGNGGTNVYFNGQHLKSNKDLTLRIPYGANTRLILGNSAYGAHSWRGDVYGLAFYRHILTAQDAARHFKRWSYDQDFSFAKNKNPLALYYFDEKESTIALDHAGGDHNLKIPSRMPILKKKFLSSPWGRNSFGKRQIEDIVLNLFGFIPLGFAFTLTLRELGGGFVKKAAYDTFFICILVSLFIETAQAWILSRSSSQLDLMCNTAGSVIGIFIAQWFLGKRMALKRLKVKGWKREDGRGKTEVGDQKKNRVKP
jgi:hypothetical protein